MSAITSMPVSNFLAAVDEVINSNAVLVDFTLSGETLKDELTAFIKSDDFVKQMIRQDHEGGWNNFYKYDPYEGRYTPKPGNLVKPGFELTIRRPDVEPKEYLIAMLTANNSIGNFFSYYGTSKSRVESAVLVENFIQHLSQGNEFDLFIIEPDFLFYGGEDREADNSQLYYFEGLQGSDSATLIVCGQNAYLLLTNGID